MALPFARQQMGATGRAHQRANFAYKFVADAARARSHGDSVTGLVPTAKEKAMKLGFTLAVAGLTSAALFVLPAVGAPIFPSNLATIVSGSDDGLIMQVRNGRGGRGGVHRGGAVRGGAVYRGGAVVRRGAIVGGGGGYYASGSCDPNYQYCGGGAYGSAVYRGGAVVRGGTVARGGAVVRGGTARAARVTHHGGRRR
jgi:hypothetical protein